MTDLGAVYGAGRGRLTELVGGVSAAEAEAVVPACPEWRVKDVIAHLSGVCADVLSGNLEGVASDPWTAAQVEHRRDWPVEQLLAEWSELAPQVEPLAPHFPGRVGMQWVLDQTTHEHDVRQALGAAGARDSEGVGVGLEFMMGGFLVSAAVRGVPPLEVQVGDRSWIAGGKSPAVAVADPDDDAAVAAAVMDLLGRVVGGGEEPPVYDGSPEGVLKLSPFELVRATTGRRSAAQIRAYDWSVDPTPYLRAFQFGPFTTRPDDLVE